MQLIKFVIAGLCLFAFLRCDTPASVTSSSFTATQTANNIIFIVGDGMGVSQVTAGMYEMGNKIVLEEFPVVGLIKTHAVGNMITDSAAGATAFATGKKTKNRRISVDPNATPLETIAEKLDGDYQTGLAVTSTITHATPACYYAHVDSRSKYPEIAVALSKSSIDVAIGFGREQFSEREDGKDLIAEMSQSGFAVYTDLAQANEQKRSRSERLAVILAGEPRGVSARPKNYLRDASQLAINELNRSSKPFFLMVEASQIDWAGHANQKDWLIDEMKDFDETVSSILDFAKRDGKTLVVVTADHETGGLGINAGDFAEDTMDVEWTTGGHTGTMVPVFAYGPGSENFAGIYDNTAIYTKLLAAIGR